MASRQLDEERIFHIARELTSRAAREDYLNQICAGDQALRERVEALLEIHEKEEDFLKSSPEPAPTVDQPPIREAPGQEIGRYKLLQKIGEGGFGVVYMAEQHRPIRRKVALKIIKPGMDTHAVVARFEAERQALALMDHPNIAHVFDAGTTESGRPFFVMELVKGIPITDFSDRNNLKTDERMRLFISVCHATQHAHQKGIIHRDIKPSNVLVTLHDGVPVVKVIDFGVAKAIHHRLTDKTLFTHFLQMIGTPLYMSPEQAEMSGLDIDTRTDIYSLGVLLYELLVGTTPFDRDRFRNAAFDEVRRIIREDDPPLPSTRLSNLGDTLTAVCAHRQTEPQRLMRSLVGDLDWIVVRSLEKDRKRRYETAIELAQDIQRHLDCEPVTAGPPTAAYRIRKFAQRNRGLIASALVVASVFLLGLIGTSWQWWRVVESNQKERELRLIADKQATQARRAEADAILKAKENRKLLYCSDIPRAYDAWERCELRRAASLLALHEREVDLHGIEWSFVTNLLNRKNESIVVASMGEVNAFEICPNKRLIAASTTNGEIRILEIASSRCLAQLRAEPHVFWTPMAFSSDGARLAFKSNRRELTVHDLSNGHQEIYHLQEDFGDLGASPDGHLLAVDSNGDGSGVDLIDWSNGSLRANIPVNDRGKPVFSPDGRFLACSSIPSPSSNRPNKIIIWDVLRSKVFKELDGGYSPSSSFAFSADGRYFAGGAYDHRIRLWDASSFSLLGTLDGHTGAVFSLAFSPSGSLLASGSRDHTVRIWATDTCENRFVFRGHEQRVNSVGFIDGGRAVVSTGYDSMRIWALHQCTPVRHLKRPSYVYEIYFASDNRLLYVEGNSNQLRQFDVETLVDEVFATAAGQLNSHVAISCNGLVATTCSNGKLEAWELETGQKTLELNAGGSAAFSADGQFIYSASQKGLRAWPIDTPHVEHTITTQPCLALIMRDDFAASYDPDRRITIWKRTTKDLPDLEMVLQTRVTHDTAITGFDVSRDGTTIATCSQGGSIRLWNAVNGEMISEQTGTRSIQYHVQFSRDGSCLLSTGNDCCVTAWDIKTLEERFRFPPLNGGGTSVAISPEGRWLASSTFSGDIQVWEVGSGK